MCRLLTVPGAGRPRTVLCATGVVLSSGAIANTIGPNSSDAITTAFGGAGDADLTALSGFPTFDAAVLEFEFIPDADIVFFHYVFGSDEYNEWVTSSFNDTFAFYVNGVNCALVDDGAGGFAPITINTINNGNPFGSGGPNAALYRNNDLSDGGGAIDTEMDGLTVVLTCTAAVNAGVPNTMKLAIADASDTILDSAVFLEEGSLSTTPPGDCPDGAQDHGYDGGGDDGNDDDGDGPVNDCDDGAVDDVDDVDDGDNNG